jgi:outer membrane protein OmpA-like peptidoglycan-associated protein
MTTLKRLLLATTILTAAGTASWTANAAPQGDGRIILAQQPAPDAEKKPDGKPPAKPGPAAKPAPAPAQPQRPAAPSRPTPPAAQQAPAPGAAQPRRPDQPPPPAARQPQPPAAQTAPQPGQRRQPPSQPQAAPPQTAPSQAAPAQTSPQQDQRRDRGPRPGERTPPPSRAPQAQPQQPAAPTAPPPAAQTPAQRPAVQTRPQAPAVAPVPPPVSTEQRRAPDAPPPPPAAAAPQQQPATQVAPQTQPPAAQPRRIEDVREQRREERRDGRTIIREGDRTIIREGDRTIIRRDEADRFRGRGGRDRDVRVERRGNENFTIAVRPGGIQIVTVTDEDGRLVRRYRRDAGGREVIIIDNRPRGPRRASGFFVQLPPPVIRIPRERYIVEADHADPAMIYDTLMAPPVETIEQGYTLDEIRYSAPLRDRMRRIDIDTITFDTGSWEVTADQADRLAPIADGMRRVIERNPNEVFMVEGYTDAVGSDIDNLSLSDRRAESVANLLSEQFGIPPENLTTQGYGEQYLKIPTEGPERQNRRVSVRRVTPLLAGQEGGPVPQ